jgi:IclR family acetate operon transcriptional repressor
LLAQLDVTAALSTVEQLTLQRYTRSSIVDENRFMAEVQQVRQKGYAVDMGEYLAGVNAVAVGVGMRRGMPFALWAVGFAESMGPDTIVHVVEAALETAAVLRKRLAAPAHGLRRQRAALAGN